MPVLVVPLPKVASLLVGYLGASEQMRVAAVPARQFQGMLGIPSTGKARRSRPVDRGPDRLGDAAPHRRR